MQFNDTTNKNGIIQGIERWTGKGDGGISGDTTLLKGITASINDAYDELMPYLLAYLKTLGFDDSNNTGNPSKTANLVSGTGSYTVTNDGTNDLLVVFDVAILPSATATEYVLLPRGDLAEFPLGISQNPSNMGVPGRVYINGNNIFFDVTPNYNATNGIKYIFNREQYRFLSSDTTKEPGFVVTSHPLLEYIPAHEWLCINKPANTTVITRLEKKIADGKAFLNRIIRAQNPTSQKVTMKKIQYL